jgi:hypothetical protein
MPDDKRDDSKKNSLAKPGPFEPIRPAQEAKLIKWELPPEIPPKQKR